MNCIENIIHEKEILLEYKSKLVKLYIEDYGKSKKALIEERSNRIAYLLDSTPDITYDFYLKHKNAFTESKIVDRIVLEAEDYKKEQQAIALQRKDTIYQMLCTYFNISLSQFFSNVEEELLNLNIECYSSKYIARCKNKKKLLEEQQKYKNQCEKLGIHAITDKRIIDKMISFKEQMEFLYNRSLLKNTIFGRRVLKELQQVDPKIEWVDLVNCLFDKFLNKFNKCYIEKSGKLNSCIVYCPLIKNLHEHIDNLDLVFLHENRHAIEVGSIGINTNYKLLNELRTEEHAIADLKRIDTIFQKNEIEDYSTYAQLLPLCSDLLKKYGYLFDQFAIVQDIYSMEQVFGKQCLRLFNKYLNSINFDKRYFNMIEAMLATEQAKILQKNALDKGYKPYQSNR